jgi:hypothetical protein
MIQPNVSPDWDIYLNGQKRKVLRNLLDFAGADARSANTKPPSSAFHQSANRLQIDVPASFRYVMRVTDPVAELGTTSANLTNLCHKAEFSLRSNSRL